MAKVITQVAQSCKHGVHSKIYGEVCVNVSSLYTIWKFQEVLTDKSFFILFLTLPTFIYFTSHLYCIRTFEDEDATFGIKYQVTRKYGEGRI